MAAMLKLSAALLVVFVAGCSLTRSGPDPVQVKLDNIDERLAKLERVMANQSLLEMAQTQDALQTDVRSLRGRVDELQNTLDQMRKQQHDLYADLDRRMGSTGAAGAGAATTPAAPSAAPSGGSATPEQQAYVQAFEALKNQNYPGAITGFKQYLATYPTSELADNAQYWLGEAYYVSRDYDNAALAFRAVGERWPNSRKASDALVKLGFTQFEQKKYAEARTTLTQVTQKYPSTDAARLAQDRIKRLPAADAGNASQ
jgi:tol-pal system protein YbgF